MSSRHTCVLQLKSQEDLLSILRKSLLDKPGQCTIEVFTPWRWVKGFLMLNGRADDSMIRYVTWFVGLWWKSLFTQTMSMKEGHDRGGILCLRTHVMTGIFFFSFYIVTCVWTDI